MTKIALPRHSVVLILGHPKDRGDLARLADRVPAISSPWDVNKPDPSQTALHEALAVGEPVRVVMQRSHAKGRKMVAAGARKRGAVAIALRLPGAEEIGADEGYAQVVDVTDIDAIAFEIVPMPCDLSAMEGSFDFVGDVHGCFVELMLLLTLLGYVDELTGLPQRHPDGRTLVLLGDLTDRGPANLAVLRMVRALETFGALRILGNHDEKLARWLGGKNVRIAAGLAGTIAELEVLPEDERREMGAWLGSAEPHLIFDGGRVIAAHAGIDEANQGRRTSGARSFALYGKVTGGLDEDGHPEAEDWALDYAGDAVVVHGHVVHPEPRVVGNVVAIDTGCVFGGSLTAYRWPEQDFMSVPAQQLYCPSDRFKFDLDQT